jgi:hypothetical protein
MVFNSHQLILIIVDLKLMICEPKYQVVLLLRLFMHFLKFQRQDVLVDYGLMHGLEISFQLCECMVRRLNLSGYVVDDIFQVSALD